MTKDDLYKEIIDKYVRCETVTGLKKILNEFFESNVCIPNGGTLQANVSEGWIDIFTPSNGIEYRIKPSEPIYEWMRYAGSMFGIDVLTDQHYTEDEIGTKPFRKKENTKRVRK